MPQSSRQAGRRGRGIGRQTDTGAPFKPAGRTERTRCDEVLPNRLSLQSIRKQKIFFITLHTDRQTSRQMDRGAPVKPAGRTEMTGDRQTYGQGCPGQAGRQDGEDEVRCSITKSFIFTKYLKTNLLHYLTHRQTNKQIDHQSTINYNYTGCTYFSVCAQLRPNPKFVRVHVYTESYTIEPEP